MHAHRTTSVALVAGLLVGGAVAAQQPGRLYEERVQDSNPIRTEQARELDAYVQGLKADTQRLHSLFRPDFRSERDYERSVRSLREAFCRSIGYPPPGKPTGEPRFVRIGEDDLAVYYRVSVPVLPGVNSVGLYLTPRNARGRRPLVISMHGGGGSPEVALFNGGSNYHDMARGGVKRGYAVWAPTHLFRADGHPPDVRNRTDDRLRLLGTSLTAVETWKITRGLDAFLGRPEIDPKRIAMVGLSYGGYYSLVVPAVDTRIKAVVSSCYFGVQEFRYAQDELSVPSDFRFPDRMTLFKDSELGALICPRALEIQAGESDAPTHREMGKTLAPVVASYYARVGRPERFRFVVFPGGHEFWDLTAWDWLEQRL